MQTDDVTVRVKPAGQPWQRFDADPESVVLSANTYGPDQASLALHRDQRVPWADLRAYTPVEVDVAGVTVWAGRLKDTAGSDYAGSLNAEGYQYVLDRVPVRRLYVHTRLSDWKDWRTNLTADLTVYRTGWRVEAGTGGVIFGNQEGSAALPRGAVYLDLGVASIAKRVIVTYEKNQWAGIARAGIYGTNTLANLNAASGASVLADLADASTSGSVAFTTSSRYLSIFTDTDTSQADDRYFKATTIQVFGDTAWESGGVSVLTGDMVIKDALAAGAPALADDLSLIAADSFVIPTLTALDFKTPRELIDGVNVLRNWIVRVGVDRRVTWKARPTSPLFHVGAWSDYAFEDASLNNGAEIYDQVAVTGTAPDGSDSVTEISQTVPLLTLADAPQKKIVTVEAPLDSVVATRIGDTFLESHRTSSLHGTVAIQGARAIRGPGGNDVHPSLLLLAAQERLRLDDRVDPDTGGVGRDGMIATVEYRHDDRGVSVELDDTRRGWDALLARYNLLAGSSS